MNRLKAQDDAAVAFAVLDAVGIASTELEHIALEVFSRKATLLLSDVPGIEAPARIAGYPLTDVSVWAPFQVTSASGSRPSATQTACA